MADLLTGLTVVNALSTLFPALLVLVGIYGLLGLTKAFGENKFVHALIAFCLAALVLITPQARVMISFITPWFTVLFIFIIFVIIAFKVMGVSDASILGAMASHKTIIWWVIGFALLIGAVGLSKVLGQGFLEQQPGYSQNPDGTFTSPEGNIVTSVPPSTGSSASGDFGSNMTRTIFNPTLLGFILLGLIATFAVYFMTLEYK